MNGPGTPVEPDLSLRSYDAVVFDMDGVVTDTASVHAAAWKKLFDEVLPRAGRVAGAELRRRRGLPALRRRTHP